MSVVGSAGTPISIYTTFTGLSSDNCLSVSPLSSALTFGCLNATIDWSLAGSAATELKMLVQLVGVVSIDAMVAAANLVEIAALVGDTARATVLAALMGGQDLTTSELAAIAGVAKSTMSELRRSPRIGQ